MTTLTTLALLATASTQPIVIHAGVLIPTGGESPQNEQTVVVSNGRIDRVVPGFLDAQSLGLASAQVIDLRDHTVLPGLIDSHVHILGELGPTSKLDAVQNSDADEAIAGAQFARRTLLAGFTTVRDVGAGDAIFAVRKGIATGQIPGPRLFAAGAIISPTGGHGQVHALREDVLAVIDSDGVCNGAAQCREAVRRQVRKGADHIKFVATGGVLSETAAGVGKQFFDDEMRATIRISSCALSP
ncbi:MAG: amidohydrolase family protein [Myxococcota bacterium]